MQHAIDAEKMVRALHPPSPLFPAVELLVSGNRLRDILVQLFKLHEPQYRPSIRVLRSMSTSTGTGTKAVFHDASGLSDLPPLMHAACLRLGPGRTRGICAGSEEDIPR